MSKDLTGAFYAGQSAVVERDTRLAAFRECKKVCEDNDDSASASEIGQMIEALTHPEVFETGEAR